MEKIKDIDLYNKRMAKSMLDKIFFIDKVFEPFDNIIDYGCANGELIKTLKTFFPEYNYFGYDISSEMIKLAQENVESTFSCNWDFNIDPEKTLINLSSVIHEVYSYSNKNDIDEFYNRIFNSNFKYITIRDMFFADNENDELNRSQFYKIQSNEKYFKFLNDFENYWGQITTQKELIHFLLKYKYEENWERELKENYLPISLEHFLDKIPENYEIVYMEHYTLPYLNYQLYQDFGIKINERTHLKLVLKKK